MLFFTGVGVGCLTLLLMIVAREYGRLPVARVFIVLILASFAFLLHPFAGENWQPITYLFQSLIPALFWLLCQLAFSSKPKLFSAWSALAAYSVLAPNFARVFLDSTSAAAVFYGWTLGTYFEYIIIAHGIWTVLSNWSDDLVSSRRHLRGAVLLVVGSSVCFAAISLNLGLAGEFTRPLTVVIPSLLTALFLLKGPEHAMTLTATNRAPHAPAIPKAEPDFLQNPQLKDGMQKLNEAMSEGFYRTENLTLKKLAKRIVQPEYKTRAVINQGMGYRNFNDYVNHLRIDEATERLIREPQTPIQNIALDIGYRSLSSFNRAFREITGKTPTEFRSRLKPSGTGEFMKLNESPSLSDGR